MRLLSADLSRFFFGASYCSTIFLPGLARDLSTAACPIRVANSFVLYGGRQQFHLSPLHSSEAAYLSDSPCPILVVLSSL